MMAVVPGTKMYDTNEVDFGERWKTGCPKRRLQVCERIAQPEYTIRQLIIPRFKVKHSVQRLTSNLWREIHN